MIDLNMEQIKDVYNKLGIPCDENPYAQNDFLSQKIEPSQFGIYVEDGFNFTNNTVFKPQNS